MDSRSRGYLPRLDSPRGTYFLTFRLEDSLPSELLSRWKDELQFQKNVHSNNQSTLNDLERKYFLKIESYLDTSAGNCRLRNPKTAAIVDGALRYFDGQRYVLHAWIIMPNHVHVLFTLSDPYNLSSIVHSWKSYTAHQANLLLGLSGRFWQPESFDRLIRSERQFEFCLRYILNNPVKAGLCKEVYQWPWKGCSGEIQHLARRFFFGSRRDACAP